MSMDKTFLKGLTLLEALARSGKACGVTELAEQLDLAKSNVHRILQGLVHQGFARKVGDTGQYELTMKLWELGSYVFAKLDLRELARPHMDTLARQTSETVHLSILDGADVLYVAKIDSPQPVRAYTTVGGRAPAQCVATGKAQLAWADAATFDLIRERLHPYTIHSITTARALDAEMERVRATGYAINRGEWREQVCGVACPLRDASGRVIAALGISGPAERLKPRLLKDTGVALTHIASELSVILGYHGRP